MAKRNTGITHVPTPSADDRGEVRSFRKRMKNGRDILVIGTNSKEAEDIIGSRNEDIESNERKHGYWHPDVRNNADEVEIPIDHIVKDHPDQPPSRTTETGRSIFMVPDLPWKDS
jgi:hypothetical protein